MVYIKAKKVSEAANEIQLLKTCAEGGSRMTMFTENDVAYYVKKGRASFSKRS